jgi:hypothetical protein
MTDLKAFHLGDLISITDGHLVAPRHMDAIYDILGYLAEDDGLTTIALPMVGRIMEPVVREQHPFLNDIVWDESISDIEDIDERKAAIDVWLKNLTDQYGEFHTVVPASDWKAGK